MTNRQGGADYEGEISQMGDKHDTAIGHVPTEGEDELMGTLERVAKEGRAQCRLCDHWVEGDDFGELFEALAEHGEEAHDWDDAGGWSP